MQQDLQQTAATAPDEDAPFGTHAARRRLLLGFIGLLCVVLLVVLPPYIGISRYQRRVAAAISGSLGRPVHFDRITLHLLPIPGLTIENFVVSENADFGSEPVLRANSVEARLRVSSLWRRRIEVSTISLDAPSINLVRRPEDGRWNLQSILMQASQMNSAPTSQRRAGDAPRFPYIEATDARINIKNGVDKLPFSVKEADFALWLPQPDQWHFRTVGKPVRTDTDVSDIGLLRIEATLGRAANLADAPIDVSASWKATPLGEAGKLTAGHDLGWRGEVTASATLHGTLRQAKLVNDVHLLALRRADFFPEHTAEVNLHCEAITAGLLRSLHDLRCAVPTNNDTSIFSAIDALRHLPDPVPGSDAQQSPERPGVLLIRGEVPNVLDWRTATGAASLKHAQANYALAWARLFTQRIPSNVSLGGTLDLATSTAPEGADPGQWNATITCACILPEPTRKTAADTGEAPVKEVAPAASGESKRKPAPNLWSVRLTRDRDGAVRQTLSIAAAPVDLPAGEIEASELPEPSARTISGNVSRAGYALHYASPTGVRQAAAVLPPLADGMPADAIGMLDTTRFWGGAALWNVPEVPVRRTDAPRRRHR